MWAVHLHANAVSGHNLSREKSLAAVNRSLVMMNRFLVFVFYGAGWGVLIRVHIFGKPHGTYS